jgi:hypothetical protein
VVPVVLLLLLVIEGAGSSEFVTVLWVGWVVALYGLLLSLSAVGQERRSLQQLFAFPITARMVFRAKWASVVIPIAIGSALLAAGAGLLTGFRSSSEVGLVLLGVGIGTVLATWGLAFAARYSDFQDRPRPQFLRPSAMIAAMGTGFCLMGLILVPGAIAVSDPSWGTLGFAIAALAVALVIGATGLALARAGFDRLFRELPF